MTLHLQIDHITTYRYRQAVKFGAHRVSFRPRTAHDIQVLSATLDVSPESRLHWIHDVFSNSIAVVEPSSPAAELRIATRVIIEHQGVENEAIPEAQEAVLYPFHYSMDDRLVLAPFLTLQYPDEAETVRNWVQQYIPSQGVVRSREILSAINRSIRGEFRYQSRDAMGTQSPAQTLLLQSGTCRDFALLMIEAVRVLGFAARFVSGYIYDSSLDPEAFEPAEDCGDTDSSLSPQGLGDSSRSGTFGAGATHAWLHVFLPGAGWVPYDPTNSLFGGTDLIRVAFARTPEQAAPITGSWDGDASDFLNMEVSVKVRKLRLPHPVQSTAV